MHPKLEKQRNRHGVANGDAWTENASNLRKSKTDDVLRTMTEINRLNQVNPSPNNSRCYTRLPMRHRGPRWGPTGWNCVITQRFHDVARLVESLVVVKSLP